jgi:hypothetical protein
MNLINTILILLIILFLINHFSNGHIIVTLKRIFNSCKSNVEFFSSKQPWCYPLTHNNDPQNIDDHINRLITTNINSYEISQSNDILIKVNKDLETYIINNLLIIFNKNKYFFSNIKLNQELYYYENYKGKEFDPFIFTTDISFNNNNLGNFSIVIDCFLLYDKNQIIIKNMKIIKTNIPDKIYQPTNQMNETINDISITIDNNDLFIKPQININKKVSFQNNETDSLIPSIDEILSI